MDIDVAQVTERGTKSAAAIAKIRENIRDKITKDKDLLALLEEVITEYEKGACLYYTLFEAVCMIRTFFHSSS